MTDDRRHVSVVGARLVDRSQVARSLGGEPLTARCHRRLRGPCTGVDTVLRAVVPEAVRRWPELAEAHRVELLYLVPELADVLGPAPRTLAADGPFRERTRYYGAGMIRCMNQGVATFLRSHADRVVMTGEQPPTLNFEDVHAADPTTQELIALLVRRADPERLRVIVSSTGDNLSSELADALADADRHTATAGTQAPRTGDTAALATEYVQGDCTSDDPNLLAAYLAADRDLVRRLHDERADELTLGADTGTRIGAIAYHREHGTDPGDRGRAALLTAFQYCVEAGFSAAVVELGLRGRAITDHETHPLDFVSFTQHAASALVPLGKSDEALALYEDLRGRFTDPKAHMIAAYGIAMLHTRFFVPRNHEAAIAWQHTACALASTLADADDRRTYEVFHANGLALVEMHRGNLTEALRLVEGGIERLDRELGEHDWTLHRSQLLYNRARLLAALGRQDEAFDDFSTLIELDPYYTDYLNERAKISRKRGDFAAALADYDRAVDMAPPFPELYYNRGTARLELGDVDGALDDFDYVLDMEPDDVDTRLSRAEIMLELEALDHAESDIRAGLRSRPTEPRLRCMLGAVMIERDDLDEALTHLNAALDADPDYPAALVNRAVVHYRTGDHGTAIADLGRVLELVGPDPDVLLNRGLAYLADERAELALLDFDAALAEPESDEAELRYQRGRCLLTLDQREQGKAELLECLRLGEGQHENEIHELLATP